MAAYAKYVSGPRVARPFLVAAAFGIAAFGRDSGTTPQTTAAPAAAPAAPESAGSGSIADAAAVPPMPAPAVTQASWAPDALEELLAPIALYPDQLLGQILAASVNPQEVLDAGNWLLDQTLTGTELDAAAEKAGFGPAMRALVQFPTVVDMMCQQMDWTRQLGSAFTSDQAAVLDAVQRLRAEAVDVGNLKTSPEQTVETKTEENKVVVEVKPADPQVVYVPQYDPQVIYTTPPPPPAPAQDTVSRSSAVAGGLLAFGAGIALANALDDDDWCYPHWGAGAVFVGPRPFYPPAYVYRPAYGPGFRPGYRYAPPPNYRHSYNNVNVNINNNNYYNRFSNNQNLHVQTQSPLGDRGRRSTYAGARNDATAERLGQAAGGQPGAGQARIADRAAGGAGAEARAGQLPQGAQARAGQASRSQHADRGYGGSTRNQNLGGATAATRPAAAPTPRQTPDAGAQRNEALSGASQQ